jgi:hypothetical protein
MVGTMGLSRRLQTLAAGILAATILLLDVVHAQENAPPAFGPPLQYTSKPAHEYDALLAANISWLKSKLTDRKRRRREAQNSFRLEPAATKPQVQAVIDLLDKEVKETEAALTVVRARSPEAEAKAKGATKQLEAARYRLDVDDNKQMADKADQEIKALGADLKAAGL